MLSNCGAREDSGESPGQQGDQTSQSWIFIGRTIAKAEALILWPHDVKNQLIGKDLSAGKDWGQEKGMIEDETVGWHCWLNGHEFEQTRGDSEGQGRMACCSSWGLQRVAHGWVTEQLNPEPHVPHTCTHHFHLFRKTKAWTRWSPRSLSIWKH